MAILYVVATPIGNLADFTQRAKDVLAAVDLIAAEDTRQTGKLLARNNLQKKIVSYHQHSGVLKEKVLLDALRSGQKVALVTDAGTPGINDPGGKLVARAWEEIDDLQVIPIPGPNAFISALCVSGFPADQFVFGGYFPRKKGRQTLMQHIVENPGVYVFYESPHRILKTIALLADTLPEAKVLLARELTKKHEQIVRATARQLQKKFITEEVPARGEFVLVIYTTKND